MSRKKHLRPVLAVLFLFGYLASPAGGEIPPRNVDESEAPPYALPDPLVFRDGTSVDAADQWTKKRRGEILALFEENVYGKTPLGRPETLRWETLSEEDSPFESAQRKIVRLHFTENAFVDLLIYLPKAADPKFPVPVALGLNFQGNHTVSGDRGVPLGTVWNETRENGRRIRIAQPARDSQRGAQSRRWPVQTVIQHGFALVTAYYCQIEPDFDGGIEWGVRRDMPRPKEDQWGSLGAWAWGLSRIMDYIAEDGAEGRLDASKVMLLGHSRLGKAALWAAAQDERFAIVVSNNSGCGGAALSSREFGETVHLLNSVRPEWFAQNDHAYNKRIRECPVDQHELIALAAPRPVYVASATEDLNADPRGEFLAALHADPVYRLLGTDGIAGVDRMPPPDTPVGGRIRYHVRTGKHDILEYDWLRYLHFAATYFEKDPGTVETLPGTSPLTWVGDCARRNNEAGRNFLDRKTAESVSHRARYWNRNFDSRNAYEDSVLPDRQRLRHLAGIRDARLPFESPTIVRTFEIPEVLAESATHRLYAVTWPVFDRFTAEGLLLEPKTDRPAGTIIHLPHAGYVPEDVLGLTDKKYEPGFETPIKDRRVLIPATIDREIMQYGRIELTRREYVHRAAYQLGRHVLGYEIQGVLALVDWLKSRDPAAPVRVEGYGDGGMAALYAGAVDTRIDELVVAGYFDDRNRMCDEPLDRNVFALLDRFGDAELASLVAPRKLTVFNRTAPVLTLTAGKGGAPGSLVPPRTETVLAEIERARKLVEPFRNDNWLRFERDEPVPAGTVTIRNAFLRPETVLAPRRPDPAGRQQRILDGMDRHTQFLLDLSERTRKEFWGKIDTTSPEAFEKSCRWYRDYFGREIIGLFDEEPVPPNPRSRKYADLPTHVIYEVELDVFRGLTAYGLLLLPKDLREGRKRPVVVCQHGRNGRPSSAIRGGRERSMIGFATDLVERGYVVFAPQNMYTLEEEFRYNQRKAFPLGKTIFSLIVPQHRVITAWLASQPFVDGDKIAFYGISYGGESAMRIPPLVDRYCLSICSADFNSWNKKVASNRLPFSFMRTREYEMFWFDLANTFDYSDMAALIAPRPFMVERGHVDTVALDEYVAFEYAKVRFLYDCLLKIPERTTIHWFDGPHRIDGTETYPFLDRWLKE